MPPSNARDARTARDKVRQGTGPTRMPARNGPWRGGGGDRAWACRSRAARPRSKKSKDRSSPPFRTRGGSRKRGKGESLREAEGEPDLATSAGGVNAPF